MRRAEQMNEGLRRKSIPEKRLRLCFAEHRLACVAHSEGGQG